MREHLACPLCGRFYALPYTGESYSCPCGRHHVTVSFTAPQVPPELARRPAPEEAAELEAALAAARPGRWQILEDVTPLYDPVNKPYRVDPPDTPDAPHVVGG